MSILKLEAAWEHPLFGGWIVVEREVHCSQRISVKKKKDTCLLNTNSTSYHLSIEQALTMDTFVVHSSVLRR